MNRYYFSMFLSFKKDIDLDKLEKVLNLNATEKTALKDSYGEFHEKEASFYYRTEEMTEIYSDDEFEKFLFNLSKNLSPLPEIMNEYDGECSFCMVFTKTDNAPCISLSKEAINFLGQLNARFDVDFV